MGFAGEWAGEWAGALSRIRGFGVRNTPVGACFGDNVERVRLLTEDKWHYVN